MEKQCEVAEELRKTYINESDMLGRIVIKLGIFKVWYELRHPNSTQYFRCEQWNAKNPLFLIVILFMVCMSLYESIKTCTYAIKKMTKISKWG